MVDFFTITPDLDALLNMDGLYARLAPAAWIADNWTTWGATDIVKGEAQKAIWKIAGVMDRMGDSGLDWQILRAASNHTDYLTDNWFFAHSPAAGTIADYQDYLTPTAPVPEPATMFLFGAGLIGLAGFGRKKLKNG